MRKPILDVLKNNLLVIDGAMGTLLLQSGIPSGSCFESANVTHPDIIKKVHKAYLDAGADIIETNTFGGSPLKLKNYGLSDRAYELNKSAVVLAREAAGIDHYVAASLGPCGRLLEPVGPTSFEEVYESFSVQARAFADGGADIVSIETMGDLAELKAAVLAVRDNTTLPIICSVTYDQNLYTMTGSDPYLVFVTLAAMGVEVIGTNCGMGPDGMVQVIKLYNQAKEENGFNTILSVMPNAGLPEMIDNKTVYNLDPVKFSSYSETFVSFGVSILGGCCGTTPEHISEVKKVISATKLFDRTEKKGPIKNLTVLTSRNKKIVISDQHLPVIIGERLNPTAKKYLSEDLLSQKTELYYKEAKAQLENAPDLLDVNVGYPGINEAEAMQQVVLMLTKHFDVPLCLDSANYLVLEKGLRVYPGKALINSVNGEEKSLTTVLPLAKKYGAAIIGLTLDEKGIPTKAEDRVRIARKIVERAQEYGINKNDIFIDTLVLAASSNQQDAMETIKALTTVKNELGVKTSLGISNISHGLPRRKLINHTFMAMALGAGLDAIIANPMDHFVRSLIAASSVITNRDRICANYIANHETFLVAEETISGVPKDKNNDSNNIEEQKLRKLREYPVMFDIARIVIEGDSNSIIDMVEKAKKDFTPQEIMEKGLLGGMEYVGANFKAQRVFLPQVMASAETMKKAFAYLKSFMKTDAVIYKGTAIIATVKGDIHDIGKNIVAMMLENNGFKVIDLGKNVECDDIIASAKEHNAELICLSSLLTTTMPEMEIVIKKCLEGGLRAKVMIGGAVVTQSYADKIGAYYSSDAIEAVDTAKGLVEII
ncbi:MAG: homocysteine methyltransferase [Candidatus Margulisiibacteriota bacterium]|nr:MAG: hypothetical protein A2X43_12785 [Candidatus Margulisbacteria bacterium GWD2_39_127]OGI02106.1 MAG: hypothetical protein A2X42_01400 [Candidatus Margulisbacteria bacterium GWF2_38_17]OGI10483.1 MAG: hypothetical protein A2X41_06900 [Candidatus Margulisbacteria bacterium GWE2_39_32]PZM79971.1 MAG: homocysteine methyltransferase [Candidatus Margulisiibacteriota bacterium]HAR62437.1 homocysteine methyltransferase [Candidatus Margulisiibacteriota bacterium]